MIIKIDVKNKIANLKEKSVVAVCGNSDYIIEFNFDAEWNAYYSKTARFKYNGNYTDVVFNGTSCNMPVLDNTYSVEIGVFAGSLHTTTPAYLPTTKSILSDGGVPVEPTQDVYNQIMTLLGEVIERNAGIESITFKEIDANGNYVYTVLLKNDETYEITCPQGPKGEKGEPGTTDYSELVNKPEINNVELSGNKSAAELGLVAKEAGKGLSTNDYDNTEKTKVSTVVSDVSVIKSKIPTEATSTNKLADKDFVNSSIATNTANFVGTFNSVAELQAYSGTKTNNDYAFVISEDIEGNTVYVRYKWNRLDWIFEYTLNNSSFTAAQWGTINSGITASKVAEIDEKATTEYVDNAINNAIYTALNTEV